MINTFNANSCTVSAIVIQETWLASNTSCNFGLLNIDQYQFISKARTTSKCGGLAIYLHSSYNYKLHELQEENTDTKLWEHLTISIMNKDSYTFQKPVIISNIYRPPYETANKHKQFLSEFSLYIDELKSIKYLNAFVCGDFNINLLKLTTKLHYNNFF